MRRRYTQGSWSIVRERRVRQTAEMMPGIRAPREEVVTPVTAPCPAPPVPRVRPRGRRAELRGLLLAVVFATGGFMSTRKVGAMTRDQVRTDVSADAPCTCGRGTMFYSYLHDPSCPFASAGVEPPNAIRDRALSLITEERQRQLGKWSIAHDDGHIHGEMASAAACYAAPEPLFVTNGLGGYDTAWPWADGEGCNPNAAGDDRLRSLVIAGALIVAEIERLTRAGAA